MLTVGQLQLVVQRTPVPVRALMAVRGAPVAMEPEPVVAAIGTRTVSALAVRVALGKALMVASLSVIIPPLVTRMIRMTVKTGSSSGQSAVTSPELIVRCMTWRVDLIVHIILVEGWRVGV